MMNKYTERLHNGIIKENPTFVMMLGMCPTLAVTSSAINAIGMGLSTAVVLTLSNMMISALRNIIPDRVRIPGFIVVVASFVTIVQLLLKAYLPALDSALGVYIPLIVVLYYSWSCRSVCFQESGYPIGTGWYRYGTWIYGRSYLDRYFP